MDEVVIAGAARTRWAGFQGRTRGGHGVPSWAASPFARSALADAGGPRPTGSTELLMGCVLPAGQGQAPAPRLPKKALAGGLLPAGLPQWGEVPATTLNKMCGSGMKAAMLALGPAGAGAGRRGLWPAGMESMTNAPYLFAVDARRGADRAPSRRPTTCSSTGSRNAYDKGRLMWQFRRGLRRRRSSSRGTRRTPMRSVRWKTRWRPSRAVPSTPR